MDRSQLGLFADIIGIIVDIMTLLGIGGLLSWSFFKQDKQPFSETVVSISSYSIKTAVCLFIVLCVTFILIVIYGLTSDVCGLIGIPLTVIAGMIAIPFCLVLCLCVYQGSYEPYYNLMELLGEVKREDS